MRPNVQFVRDTLYSLKRDWGVPIKYGIIIREDTNLNTGRVTVAKAVHYIKKVVLVSNKLARQFIQDIAYLAANKNFTYGMAYDENTTIFVVDVRDVPRGLKLDLDHIIYWEHQKYVVQKAEILEHGCGWLLVCKHHVGANPFELSEFDITQTIAFEQEIAYDLS